MLDHFQINEVKHVIGRQKRILLYRCTVSVGMLSKLEVLFKVSCALKIYEFVNNKKKLLSAYTFTNTNTILSSTNPKTNVITKQLYEYKKKINRSSYDYKT